MLVNKLQGINFASLSKAPTQPQQSELPKKNKGRRPRGVVENIVYDAMVGGAVGSGVSLLGAAVSNGAMKFKQVPKVIAKSAGFGAVAGLAVGVGSYFVTNERSAGFKRFQDTMLGAAVGSTAGFLYKEIASQDKVKMKNKAVPIAAGLGALVGFLPPKHGDEDYKVLK